MDWLTEDPWPLIGVGVAAVLLLGVAFHHTRRIVLLAAVAGVLLMTSLGVLAEWLVVTQREEVENTMYAVAEALESNDLDRVLAHLAPDEEKIRASAKSYLGMFHVLSARVTNMDVTIVRGANPPRARVRFQAWLHVSGSGPDIAMFKQPFKRWFVVGLRKEQDHWLLTNYEMDESAAAFPYP